MTTIVSLLLAFLALLSCTHLGLGNYHHGGHHPPGHGHHIGGWSSAHATPYGVGESPAQLGGACGYKEKDVEMYGKNTAALSTALFNNGYHCGACYEVKCQSDSRWCLGGSVVITATNFCPPNYALSSNAGGWCNPPLEHFDLNFAAFQQIARYEAGIVPISYRRVTCRHRGGMRFTIDGHMYFNIVLISNVGGVGDIQSVYIKGSRTGWSPMLRNWGQKWVNNLLIQGQTLSFKVTKSDGKSTVSYNVAPANWQYGQTFIGAQSE